MLALATKFAPQPEAFDRAYRAGFRNAELWLDGELLRDWRNVADLARRFPFGYVLHFPNRLDDDGEMLLAAVELHRALGCRAMVIHRPMYEKHADALRKIEPALPLSIENHKLSPKKFQAWAEASPALTLDVEHLWKFTLEGAPLKELLARVKRFLTEHGEKLRHVHLPGYVPGWPEHRPMYCSRDFVFGVFDLLEDFGYRGLVVGESDGEHQNDFELRMDVLLFDAWRNLHRPAHAEA